MFPAHQIEKIIRDEITSAVNDRPIPRAKWEPEVDSLVMVRVALRVEEDFALQLPDDIMPSGGFQDVEHCVASVMETCRKLWNVNQPVKEEV
jgi:acyl carrier protein